MSEKLKQSLLTQINVHRMIEDFAYSCGYIHDLTEDEVAQVIDGIYDSCDIEDLFYSTFKQYFKRSDSLEKYIKYQDLALRSTDDCMEVLDHVICGELNKVLPEDRQIIMGSVN